MRLCMWDAWYELEREGDRQTEIEIEREWERERVPLRLDGLSGMPRSSRYIENGAPLHSLQQPGNKRKVYLKKDK